MSEYKNTNIQITTFINPHLFWFFLCEDAKKRESCLKDLQRHVGNPPIIKTATRGQVVLVYDKTWKRGYIKESSNNHYTCWLSDYGVFYDCDKVYKIPDGYNANSGFIKQAALSDVVNVTQTFKLSGFESTQTIKFCPGTSKFAKDCIEDARRIFFHCLSEENGIHLGKIEILRQDGHIYDLAASLTKRGMLTVNKEAFAEALRNNVEMENLDFFPRSASSCVNKTKKKSNESLREIVDDIAESKGIGRGVSRGNRLKDKPGPAPANKSFVEDWLKDSTKLTPKSDLNYESDESENAAQSPNVSGHSLKSPTNKSSSPSPVPALKSPRRSFDRLKQALLQTRNNASPSSNISATNISTQRKSRSSEFNPIECLSLCSDSMEVDYGAKEEIDSVRSDISSVSSDLRKTANSDSPANKSISSKDVLQSLFEASKSRESQPMAAKSEPEAASDVSSVNDGYIALLQKKFESSLKASPEKTESADTSSVKSTPSRTSAKWRDDSKAASKPSSLNLIPAGMIPAEPKKKQDTKSVRSVHYSGSNSSASELQRKQRLAASSSNQYSRHSSSASSSTSLQKLSEYARGLPNSQENCKSARELLKQNCTQGCTCLQCKEWDTQDSFVDNKEFVDTKPNKKKATQKPLLLLKTEKNDKEEIELQSHASYVVAVTKTERAIAPKIVVHGDSLSAPTQSISAVPFHANIHRVLRSFEHVYTIQSYVWPCTMRHNNICMVSAPKSGKTMAYLPAICSYLLDKQERYEELPSNTISPIAIILCPGIVVAENVQDLVLKLIDHCPYKPTCAFAVPPVDKKCLNQFQKQCDLLITTPLTLISLLQARIITVKRLCHLVIESGDKVLERFPKELDSLLKLAQSMLEHRSCSLSIQLIVCAEHWTLQLENLMKRLYITPVICVSSHLEAALYGRVDIQVQFLEAKNKKHTLADFLKDTAPRSRTIVICNNDSDVEEAKEHLNTSGVNCAFITSAMEKHEIVDMEIKWKCTMGGKHIALLCTDQVFNNSLTISDAVVLVHYSLPDTWTSFASRFSCLLDNYISPLASKVPNDWVRCKVHIFVDEACTKQFPKLMQLLQRMGANLSTTFTEFYMQTIKVREEEKLASKIKLCSNLQLFGKCLSDNRQLYQSSADSGIFYSSLNCKRRHILSAENDYSSNLPKCGVIKFKIINVQDVTTFTIQILEHTDLDGKVHKWENYENLDQDLQEAVSEQKICVFDAKLGGWYVFYSEKEGSYFRCTVQKILQVANITKTASQVYIRCLDSGVEKKVPCSSLYELPKKFRRVPPQGVDIILANTVPPDSDERWSSSSISKVKYTLKEAGNQEENVYCISQISLQLGNIIWVKNILLRENLEMVDTIVTKLNLRKSLKDQNLVSYSDEPLESLYGLCKNAGIELPDFSKLSMGAKEVENRSKQQVQPQWAYFEDCDCNEIYISCVVTPGLFYVRLKKFYDLFENLQKDIQEVIAKPFYPKDFEVEVGKYYLAKDFAGDDYCRVKVTEIRENIAECFYVDFGDYASINVADIKFLTDQYIVKLPFQVIECRLYGIQPAWDETWDETAINILQDYIFEPGTDYFRTLYTTTCIEEASVATGSKRCAILLVDNFKENKIVLINQLLIDCGEGVNIAGEDLDKEFSIPEVFEEPDEDPNADDFKDKELTIEEIERHAAKYKEKDKVNNNNSKPLQTENVEEVNASESNDSEPSWDIVMDDPETFMKLLIGVKVNTEPTVSSGPELPPMRALEYSGHYTPNVMWFQTVDLITISIMIPDLKDYTLRVTRNRMIMFKTTYEEKQYCLELQLYDKVKNTFEYKVYGQYLKVLLTKCTSNEWPRLIFSPVRMRHIKYDISRIAVPEEEKKTFLKFAGADEDLEDGGCVVDIGSDEDYSESDVDSLDTD